MVPQRGFEPRTYALSRRRSTPELLGHKYCMITEDEAVVPLYEVAQGPFPKSASYSCVQTFALSFPTKDLKPFVKDELKWDGKIFGSARRT